MKTFQSAAPWRATPLAHALALALVTVLSQTPVLAQAPAARPTATASRDGVQLNFVNADIDAVARGMASLTRSQMVVDPRVKGTLTLMSSSPVSAAQALRLFATQLRTQGFAMVESGGVYTVVPEAEAKLQNGAVYDSTLGPANGQVVTQIFRLDHESAGNLVPILRPLISPNNTITASPASNTLVITDYADNVQRLSRIIRSLDTASATGIDVIPLKHAIASDTAPLVQRLIDNSLSRQGGSVVSAPGAPAPAVAGGSPERATVLADARTNALIVHASSSERLALVRQLVDQLDQPSAGGTATASGNIHVVYLKNAEAVKLAATLRAALQADARSGSTPVAGAAPVAAASPGAGAVGTPLGNGGASSTGGQIQADAATNSLIITAPEPVYRQMRAVIDQLDTRRAQVFVESLIAEVSEDKAAQFGIQWQGLLGNVGNANVGLLGTNFQVGGANLLQLAAQGASGTALPASGLNVGIASKINGTYVLTALGRLLQSNGDGNVLSTPNLLTLDNEEARIVIGQNVPFVTGQYTNNNTLNGSVNPFQTIERRDIGLTLRVKPQISENGSIRMQIYQEVSRLDPTSLNTGLITNKRSIESNVLVDDGAIIVLGGLLQDDTSNNQEKIPVLGNLPLIGGLFRSEARNRKKTNLMVFLRPVVVRDAQSADALTLGRYQSMQQIQSGAPKEPTPVLPVGGGASLPEWPAPKR